MLVLGVIGITEFLGLGVPDDPVLGVIAIIHLDEDQSIGVEVLRDFGTERLATITQRFSS